MMKAKSKLIINADDLGMSMEVNRQIEECVCLGVVTSSTLMANAPAFDDGVRIAKQYPHISVGVHLNIIEFAPLTNADIFKKHGVVGDDGNFIEGAIFCVPIDEELKNAILMEWNAQISKIEAAGLTPTHCDSHQHTHTIPALQDVLCQVLDEHNIHKVRRKIVPSILLMIRERKQSLSVHLDKKNAIQPPKRSVFYRRFHLFVVKFSSWIWNRKIAKRYSVTNAFYSFRDFYANCNRMGLFLKKNIIELMCHPGNKPFQNETDNLMKVKCWLGEKYTLISYHEL